MKKIVLALLLFSTTWMFAQKKSATDKALNSSCNCMEKVDKNLPTKKIKAEVEKCVTQSIFENLEGLANEYDIDFTDAQASYKLGEKLGIKLATKCPAFLELAKAFSSDEEEINESSNTEQLSFTEGKLKEYSIGDVITLIVEETNGDIRNFVLYNHFTGADDFVKAPKDYVGKNVKIAWSLTKVFDKNTLSFIEKKVVRALEMW